MPPTLVDKVFWSEMRPEEEGRYVICCWSGGLESITPDGFSSRTLVHEYGGGAFFVHKYRIYFSNYEDQRMYCQKIKKSGTEPVPITPKHKAWRYADGAMYKKNIVVCVREDHEVLSEGAEEAQNTVVSINRKKKEQVVLVSYYGSHNLFAILCKSAMGRISMLITSENSRVKDRYDHQFKFFIEFFEEILGKMYNSRSVIVLFRYNKVCTVIVTGQ